MDFPFTTAKCFILFSFFFPIGIANQLLHQNSHGMWHCPQPSAIPVLPTQVKRLKQLSQAELPRKHQREFRRGSEAVWDSRTGREQPKPQRLHSHPVHFCFPRPAILAALLHCCFPCPALPGCSAAFCALPSLAALPVALQMKASTAGFGADPRAGTRTHQMSHGAGAHSTFDTPPNSIRGSFAALQSLTPHTNKCWMHLLLAWWRTSITGYCDSEMTESAQNQRSGSRCPRILTTNVPLLSAAPVSTLYGKNQSAPSLTPKDIKVSFSGCCSYGEPFYQKKSPMRADPTAGDTKRLQLAIKEFSPVQCFPHRAKRCAGQIKQH